MKKKTDKNTNKKKFGFEIFIVSVLFSALFIFMTYYVVDYAVKNKQELISNSYNGRQKILAAKNIRGTIYSKDKDVLVSSEVNEEGTEVRTYHYGPLFSHIIGYAVNGKMGVEAYANYYLINSNEPISEKAKKDAKDEKYMADSVYTTLDVNLQQVASNAMGVYKGAIIVTEPSTGKILALVSKPDFDPAEVVQNWDSYISDNESGVLVNRVTQGLYPPGSTFKIITSLEYIREHPENYNNYTYNCTGSISKGEDKIQCYHGSVHGNLTFMKSFAKSCNSSYANIGLSLDRDKFGETLDGLLFNQKLPTELVTIESPLTVNWKTDDSDMMQISIGQGLSSISPIHLNMITMAIANNGLLMEPYVVDRVENTKGNVIKQFKSVPYGHLITEEEADVLKEMMEDVVIEGTGTKLKDQPYIAAGKTGSAEYGTVKGDSHAWFTGFAREDSEKEEADICVTIIIEGAGAGGEYAVPIAKRIFDAYYGL